MRFGDNMLERTLVIVKPDGVKRGLANDIIQRYEKEGLRVLFIRKLTASDKLLSSHYAAHVGKTFYEPLKKFMMSGPVVATVMEGEAAVSHVRRITGATDPSKAEKGTVRGDFGIDSQEKADREKRAIQNLVHASGTPEEAGKEIKLWFPEIV